MAKHEKPADEEKAASTPPPAPEGDNIDEKKSPETVQRAMRKMAERVPAELAEMTMMGMGMMGNPLHQKMNEAHITKMLDLAVQHDTNEYGLRKNQQDIEAKNDFWDRWFHLIYFTLFMGLVVTILILFRNQPTVLVPILTGVGGVVTGFVGGVGYAKAQKKAKSE